MSGSENNSQNESFTAKRVKPRYINLFENIFLSLSGDTLKLYLALRFEADYATECSSVKKNIKFLMNQTGLARRQVFYSIKELELAGLVMREANPGYQSTYWVAQDLGHFTPKPEDSSEQENETEEPPVQDTHGVVQNTHGVVQNTHNINNNLSTNSFQTTTEHPTPEPTRSDYQNKQATSNQAKKTTVQDSPSEQQTVVVFESSNQDKYVLNKLKDTPKENRPDCTQVQFLKQIKYHIEKHYPDNFNKGVNAVAKLLRNHKWSTPSGYVDMDAENAKKKARERAHQAQMKAQEEMAEQRRKELEYALKRPRNEKPKIYTAPQYVQRAIKSLYDKIGDHQCPLETAEL